MTLTERTTTPSLSDASATRPGLTTWTWRRFTRYAVVATILPTLLMMAMGRFIGPSLIVLDLVLLAGLWRMRGGGRRGLAMIGLINLANLLLHAPINAALLRTIESPFSFPVATVAVLASLAALIGAVATWRDPDGSPSRAARGLVAGGVAITTAAMLAGGIAYATRTSDTPQPGDAIVLTNGTKVTPQKLEVRAGTVTINVTNADALSPRAFDIDGLDVHLILPPRTSRSVTFDAPAGTYKFHDQFTFTEPTSGELIVR